MKNQTTQSLIVFAVALVAVVALGLVASRMSDEPIQTPDVNELVDQDDVTLNVPTPIPAPELTGITDWINSDPLTIEELKGKVIVVDFWTYSCINCVRTLPYLTDWHEKYADDGLVILGVHAPEFAFEKIPANVEAATREHGIEYPVALDNDFATWRAYSNRYWPAKYFIDRDGRVRHYHFGEGEYAESEAVIRKLLTENGSTLDDDMTTTNPASAVSRTQTPETYLGYAREANNQNGDLVEDDLYNYTEKPELDTDEWAFAGQWTVTDEYAEAAKDATLRINFSAKDVYLVIAGTGEITATVNGETETIAVTEDDIYTVVSLPEYASDQLLELEVSEGLQVHAFTFGS